MLHNVSGPGPVYSQPRSDICLISTLDGELPNGEILYMSYVFAFHFCQGTEQSRRVESWNISSTKLVPVISFLPTCFRALEKRELCHLWGGGEEKMIFWCCRQEEKTRMGLQQGKQCA
jgi:hypothetical protein